MTIQLGDIALTRLQAVEVDEDRNFVEFRVPGAKGSVFQDLGRSAQRLVLRGILLGEPALREIEALRTAHAKATPLAFSGDIAVGSELTDVIIERFEVRQIPGHAFRYEYMLRVREWTEPPSPPGADLAAVDGEIGLDGDRWAAGGDLLAAGLGDVGALAMALVSNPDLLARLDVKELTQAVVGTLGSLTGEGFANLLGAVSGLDPAKALELLESLGEVDSLQELFEVVTGEGIDLLEQVTGIDLSKASAVVKGFMGGADYVRKVEHVIAAARALLRELRAFNPGATFSALQQGAP